MVNSQIQPATLFKMTNRPMNTMIWLKTGAFSTGLTMVRSMSTPAPKDTATAKMKASHTGKPIPRNVQAMNVENIAISPWAKLK